MSRTVVLVPVPSSAAARRRRGDRLVLRLALHAAAQARAAGVDVRVLPALRLVRRVADQAGLGRLARAANLDQAMAVRASARHCLSRRRCVVIDDVLTTGVTVREAGRALRAGGAVLLGVVGGCATPRVGGLSDGPHLH